MPVTALVEPRATHYSDTWTRRGAGMRLAGAPRLCVHRIRASGFLIRRVVRCIGSASCGGAVGRIRERPRLVQAALSGEARHGEAPSDDAPRRVGGRCGRHQGRVAHDPGPGGLGLAGGRGRGAGGRSVFGRGYGFGRGRGRPPLQSGGRRRQRPRVLRGGSRSRRGRVSFGRTLRGLSRLATRAFNWFRRSFASWEEGSSARARWYSARADSHR